MGKIIDGVYCDSAGNPAHRGVVEVDGKIYYAGKGGIIAKDERKTIHHGMANGLVSYGTYYFDKDGVIDKSSFKKTKKKSNKAKKPTIKQMVIIFVLVVAFLCVLFGISSAYSAKNSNAGDGEQSAVSKTQLSISVDSYKEEVYLCVPEMERYYKGEVTLKQVANSITSAYKPFVFRYTINNAESAVLKLGEKENLTDGVEYQIDVSSITYSVNNLKIDTTYYYEVSAKGKDGQTKKATGSFKTAKTNRFIYLPGVYNTRDIGGYETVDGKRVKQGLLIRGTEIDGLVESTYFLTDASAAEPFKFKCDFDLRESEIFNSAYVSPLGKNVTHKFYNSPSYGYIFASGKEIYLRQIFADLADPKNYPMYFHCTYGADRTGTIVFLLQGLLGVSEEDMKTEYKLTGFFSSSYTEGDRINPIYFGLEGVSGDTVNKKIENYLVNKVGVTKAQIESIRSIFLENK